MSSLPKKAMLLAAGLGERLRPLTLSVPKPLLRVADIPVAAYNLSLLKKFGVDQVLINLYHLGGKIEEYFGDGSDFGMHLVYSRESTILGTGGGVKAAEDFFEKETFFLLNADILIDLDLSKLALMHFAHRAQSRLTATSSLIPAATLVVTRSLREDIGRYVFVNEAAEVVAIGETRPDQTEPRVFCGAQILGPEIFEVLPKNRKACLIEDGYQVLLSQKKRLSAFDFAGYWRDIGTPERLNTTDSEIRKTWPYTQFCFEPWMARCG